MEPLWRVALPAAARRSRTAAPRPTVSVGAGRDSPAHRDPLAPTGRTALGLGLVAAAAVVAVVVVVRRRP
jgi:hypothetical protein